MMVSGFIIMATIFGIITFIALCLFMKKLDKFGEEIDIEIEEMD